MAHRHIQSIGPSDDERDSAAAAVAQVGDFLRKLRRGKVAAAFVERDQGRALGELGAKAGSLVAAALVERLPAAFGNLVNAGEFQSDGRSAPGEAVEIAR